MRTYYRGPEAVVTSTVFASRSTPKPYAIRELRNVCIHRTEPTQPTAVHVAVAFLAIAVTVWPLWKASPLYALALVTLGMPALAAGVVLWRLRPQVFQLRATYRGTEVTLFASSDQRIFNQVSRALRRAIEDVHPPATWDDLAVA
jgi:hypothetical protein